MSRTGKVFLHAIQAGVITEDETGYSFAYSTDYLQRNDAEPVSLTLPLRDEPFTSKTMLPFFDGLIPEGWLLDIVQSTWKIDSRDRMGLLLACCKDCYGTDWQNNTEVFFEPVLDVSKFFEVALFSFITGNADMHLKNFSLIRLDNKMTALAPAYDLLATRLIIPEQDDPEEMALTLNGKKSRLHFSDFYTFGKTVGLNSKQVENSFKRFARFMPAALDFLKNAFIERERITAFKDLISERAARLKIT